MRKIYLLLSLVLLVSAANVSAKKRTLEEMRKAATTSLQQNRSRRSPSLNAAQLNVVKEESQLTVLSTDNQFAVIANDDDFDAVLAYSNTPFDKEALENPGLRWWLEAMNETLEEHATNGTRPRKVNINSNYKRSVDSFVPTKWNQSDPFNWQTPTYTQNGKESHFVTGCVATAMAQCMKYYNYPATGKGSASYRFNTTNPAGESMTSRINVNFAAGNYEWDKMLNLYEKSFSTESANAVAKLMFHCGASVKMEYSPDGSGSYLFKAVEALKSKFLYNENMHYYRREYVHIDEWADIIFRNLSAGYPILAGGQSKSGGHAFVFDGYSSAGLVSVNWGWGGKGDGYFDMTSLNGYSSGQDIVPVVLPDVLIPYHSSLSYYTETPPSYRLVMGSLYASATYIVNTNYEEFSGQLGLMAQDMTTGKVVELDNSTHTIYGYGYNGELHYTSGGFSKIDISSLTDGKYRIYMASKCDKDTGWQPVRGHESIINSAILTISGSKASIENEKSSAWTGIQDVMVSNDAVQSATYNLSGQKLNTTPGRGIYIKNGKKYIK